MVANEPSLPPAMGMDRLGVIVLCFCRRLTRVRTADNLVKMILRGGDLFVDHQNQTTMTAVRAIRPSDR